jgi:hypothetical protein
MGTTHSSTFTCSTSAAVHSPHALSLLLPPSCALMHALSKNLIKNV